MKKIFLLPLFILIFVSCENENVSYKDPSQSIDLRVESLLSEMTLEEKVVQLQCFWNDKAKLLNEENWFSIDSAKKYAPHGLGQVGRPSENRTPAENAKFTNAIQRYFVEETRLGIPVLFHEECLHGHAAKDKTSFSQPIGLASTWNKELVEDLYQMTAREARSVGTHLALTPVVDVAREPRWGRVEETFGEDPYLVAQMGLAAVKGFQGDGVISGDRIMATLKHFAAHGQPESGTNAAPVNISERTLRETFLYPFEVAVKQGKVRNIMASYNEIDGVPSHANSWLLETVLRDEWGFEGVVVSDYYAIEELSRRHHVVDSYEEAGVKALESGVDIELPEPVAYLNLAKSVEEGLLDITYIDRAVRRILRQKFEMGLFENPYVDESKVIEKVDTKPHHALAGKAAEETMVLLKNKGNVLPIDPSKKLKIAVIGPNADRVVLGGYSGEPSYFVTVLEGIQSMFGKENVSYALGCQITKDSVLSDGEWVNTGWAIDPVEVSQGNEKSINEAVRIAQSADIVILCLGGNEQTSREAWVESHLGDRTDLQLVGQQMELVRAIKKVGKPIVSLLFNGKPLAVSELSELTDALIECWYLGSENGNAIAKILSGQVSPSGKLPITFPRSVGHLPAYYNYKPTARRGYLFDDISPLYAFGFGLSYAQFTYGEPSLQYDQIDKEGRNLLSVEVTNEGRFAGQEVVQLYIRDKVSSVTRPIKELKGFQKISLAPGERKKVRFEITSGDLKFWTIDKKYEVESGEFEIMVGSSSRDEDLQSLTFNVN